MQKSEIFFWKIQIRSQLRKKMNYANFFIQNNRKEIFQLFTNYQQAIKNPI